MSESLADLMAAEQAAAQATPPTVTPQEPEPSVPPAQPESPPEPVVVEPTPTTDDFIKEASEATGMDLSDLKDKQSFLQSYAAMRRKMSERDELHRIGEQVIKGPYADKVLAVLRGQAEQPELTQPIPTPSAQPPSEPEWDASWDALVQGENPPPDILAKYNRRRAWERHRAESLIKSEYLQELAADPEAFIKKLIEPHLTPLRETQEQEAARHAAEQQRAQVRTVLAPVEKQIFAGEWGDWNTVTPFGDKVKQRYLSEPALVQSSPIDWMKQCVQFETALTPQPKPTLPVPAAAQRAPNAGPASIDPDAVEKAMNEWQALHPTATIYDIQRQYDKLQGKAQ